MARAAGDAALAHVKDRSQFGTVLAKKQLVQDALVEIESSIVSARAAVPDGARCRPTAAAPPRRCPAMAKRQGVQTAERVAGIAMRLCGAMGLAEETGVERHLRDIRMLGIPDGTHEVLTLIGRSRDYRRERALR